MELYQQLNILWKNCEKVLICVRREMINLEDTLILEPPKLLI